LGDILYFDPTDSFTPIGQLPPSLQSSHGLLVLPDGGELVRLPLLPPTVNRLLRVGRLTLSPTGALSGEVQEIRWGSPAVSRRAQLLDMAAADRRKVLESFLAGFLTGVTITEIEVENLENHSENLVVRYRFEAKNYAKVTGDLLLLRPRVLGAKGDDILERKERKYPIEFDDATLQSDLYEIRLPAGFVIDELPPPAEVDTGFARYESKTQVESGVLRYTRTYQIQDVRVPVEKLEDLKKFYRRVASDERNSAVLKRSH
jgi:hypothetical protein